MTKKTRTRDPAEQNRNDALHTHIMQEWAEHLWDSLTALQRDIQTHRDEIQELKKEVTESRKAQEALGKYAQETHAFLTQLHERVTVLEEPPTKTQQKKTEEGQSRTSKDTSQGQVPKDKDTKKDNQGHQRTQSAKEPPTTTQGPHVPKILNQAQEELLGLLYRSDDPLDYDTIASRLNKKGKSIRNLIYELREKGIQIQTCHLGDRKKGFYIAEDEKIRVSGR